MTQNNLGNALYRQGERSEGVESARLLAEAVTAYRAALLVYTREQLPQDWAMTQSNLGAVLYGQGERSEGAESARLLGEAVTAYRNALSVRTREQLPQDWAMTQSNLGVALRKQGERSEGAESARLLAEAVTAYRAALLVYTREQLPQDWAMTQNNLGVALSTWAKRSEGVGQERLLKEAVNALLLALQVNDRRYLPREWVRTQNNLANVYFALRDWSHAADCYANVLVFYPGYEQGFQRASSLYHEVLFKFPEAFELKYRWLATHSNDASVLPDFAENHFTTGRFAECQERIAALLAESQLAAGTKSALRMIEIANRLALGQAKAIPDKLDVLIATVAAQPADFKITWTFDGTLHFIGKEEKLAARRDWLQRLFRAATAENRDAILNALREAKASFKQ